MDCASCHLRQQQRFGPRALEITSHGPVKVLPLMRSSEFCSPCHQFGEAGILVNGTPLNNTFEEWRGSRYSQEGIQCQDCHMRANSRFAGIHDPKMIREELKFTVVRDASYTRLLPRSIAGHRTVVDWYLIRIRRALFMP